MRTFDPARTEFGSAGPITVARWEQQYQLGERELPFGAMWYTVPAGGSSVRDQHPEPELSIVLSGTAQVEAGGGVTEVPAGQAFLLDSEEAHVIHNRADQPVLIFSAYWMPLGSDPVGRPGDTAAVNAGV
ncbi:MAG TPA: cupin domain-containing protein [Jatrophihabitans sp.]|nr:cupin domain-containing protein [Jatrophihabitans sp.]